MFSKPTPTLRTQSAAEAETPKRGLSSGGAGRGHRGTGAWGLQWPHRKRGQAPGLQGDYGGGVLEAEDGWRLLSERRGWGIWDST